MSLHSYVLMKRTILLACAMLIAAFAAFPQDSTLRTGDSLNNLLLQQQSQQIKRLEDLRIADSVRRAELENQLREVSAGDNAKKDELNKQLQKIALDDSLRLLERRRHIDSLRRFITGFGVAPFFEDTLFYVFNRQGSFSARERAAAITERIIKASGSSFGPADSLKLISGGVSTDIYSGAQIIMSVSEDDALIANATTEELAGKYRDAVKQALEKYRAEISWQTIVKEILLALLVLAVLSLIIIGINRGMRRATLYIQSLENTRLKGIRIRNYTLFNAAQEVKFLLSVTGFLRWVLIIIAVYISLPILFSIFPWTKGFADTLIGYILSPVKKILVSIWNFLPNFFTILVIVIVFSYFIKGVRFLKMEVERGDLQITGFYPDWANPTFQIIKILVYAFMLVVIFPYLPGSDSPAFKGVSVFLGLLFTFGSAGSLSNIIAGLVLTYMRAFHIGDRVKIGDITGDLIEKNLLVRRIRTIKNEIISIPNSNVMNSHIINYSSGALDRGLIVYTTITIGYDVPWRQVHALLIAAASATELTENDPAPFVLQTALDDFFVSYQLNAYTKHPNKQAVIYSQLHQHIQDKFNEAGVEIMSPHFTGLRDGNKTTIPGDYLPKNYKAPGFNMQ